MDLVQLGLSIDTRAADRGTRAVRGFATETQKAGRTVTGATTKMAQNWKVAAAAATAAVVALRTLGSAIRVLREFEGSMAAVGAISRASVQDLAAMRDVAKELGSSTEFSAAQAADGMRFLAMAGFDAKQSMAAIPDVLDLATASGMGLANAADIASNIMSAFSVEAENASDVTDALAAVSSRANTSVEQLGDAMKFVGPVAAALDISINDAAAAMGVLSDNGLQGSLAGTGLRKVLSSLVNPTTEAEEALSAMGVALEDLNPQTNDLTDIVDTLAGAGLDAADALTIFGDRGGPAILALTNSRGRLRELTAEMENVDGAATDMAATMRDNLEGDAMSLVSAMQGLIIAIGDAGLTAVLRGLIQTVTLVTRGFTAMVDAIAAVPGFVAEFLGMGAAQRELADAADAVATAMNEEIAKSDVLSGSLSSGRTMSIETAQVKLAQAQAHMAVVDAMRQEAIEEIKASDAFQRQVELQRQGNELVAEYYEFRRQAAEAGMEEGRADAERLQSYINGIQTAVQVQQDLLEQAGELSPEYLEAQANIDMLKAALADATGETVTLGDEAEDAAGSARAIQTAASGISFSGAAAEAQELAKWLGISLSSALALARTTPMMADEDLAMSGGVIPDAEQRETNRNAIENFNSLTAPSTSRGGGGGGGGGMSEAQKQRNALMEEGRRMTLAMRTEQEKYNQALARNNELLQAGAIDQQTFEAANQSLNEELAQAQFGEAIRNIETLSAGLLNAAMNGDNLGEALVQMLAQMAVQWLSAAIAAKAADTLSGGILSASMGGGSGGVGGLVGALGSIVGGARAQGGPVKAGVPYLVNENTSRSEVMVPSQSGGVLNVAQAQKALAGSMPRGSSGSEPQVEVVVLDDPRKIDEYRTSPQGEKARRRADRRLNNG